MKKAQILLVLSLLAFFLFACSLTKKYDVVFDPSGGAWTGGGSLVQKVPSGEAALEPLVEREGYDFAGWSADFLEVTTDLTVIASWEIQTFTVQFETDGGIYEGDGGPLVQTVNYQDSAVAPILTKTDFVFAGWSVDYSAVSEDLVVFPLWRHFNGDEICQMMGAGVVEIFVYGKFEEEIRVGSGFFRNGEGEIITNFHIIAGAYYLKVKVSTGKILEVTGILGYSIALDLAILKVDYEPIKYLTPTERTLEAGGNIFAVGSSHGTYTTLTSGS
jgi:S1-C subfamily serine protease